MQKSRVLFPLIVALLLVGCGATSSSDSLPGSESSSESPSQDYFNNPVFEPVLADPSIIRADDGTFYAYGTQDNALWGDYYGTKYGPILSSRDLVNWTFEDAVFKVNNMPTWGTLGAGIWAPDVVRLGDKYLYYYSLSLWGDPNPGIGVASGDTPLGPWTDHGKIFDSEDIGVGNSIDSTVVIEDDRVYMVWGSFRGIFGIELSADGLSLKNPETAFDDKVLLAGIVSNWNIRNHEGPHIRKIGNYYYMFLSTGTCCNGLNSTYKVVVARSESIMGPYKDREGRDMAGVDGLGTLVIDGNEDFVGVGHNALIQDDTNDWWLVYHGFDTTKNAQYGTTNRRSLLIDKLEWTEDLWPYVEGYGASKSSDIPFINK